MTATLVDSNVLIDAIAGGSWTAWSTSALRQATNEGRVLINPIIYAEVSVGFERAERCDAILDQLRLVREPIPWLAAFLAGKAFADYRRRGGRRRSPPDFFIGAHAAVRGLQLLTRDPTRYRTYFPRLELVSPD